MRSCEKEARIILLRRTSSTGQIFEPLLIMGPDGLPTIHIEAAVTPLHHIFNDRIVDFALSFEHLKNFVAESAGGGLNLSGSVSD